MGKVGFIVLIVLSAPALAGADGAVDCPGRVRRLVTFLGNYSREVKQTRGLRLILRKSKPEDHQSARLLNVLTEYTKPNDKRWYSAPIRDTLQFIPRVVTGYLYDKPHELTPLKGVEETLIQRPTEFVTGRVGDKKRLTHLVTLPLHLLAFGLIYSQFDEEYSDALEESIRNQIEVDKDKWDELMESDYRFADIKKRRDQKELNASEARIQTHNRVQLLKSYQIFMQDMHDTLSPAEQEEILLAYPNFSHISQFATNGVPKLPGYAYSENYSAELSSKQKQQLIKLTHVRSTLQDIIPHFVHGGESLTAVEKTPSQKEMLDSMRSDPFTNELFGLRQKGKISTNQLIFRMQEDAAWRIRQLEWSVVGAHKLKDNEPMTIEDIHQQMRQEILGD